MYIHVQETFSATLGTRCVPLQLTAQLLSCTGEIYRCLVWKVAVDSATVDGRDVSSHVFGCLASSELVSLM